MLLADAATAFSRCIRTGRLDASLNIPADRLEVYIDLVQSGVKDTLKKAYPLAHSLLTEQEWGDITSAFFAEEDCPSPLLWKMPKAFLEFARKKSWDIKLDIPFLLDLLDFEWLEIEVFMMPDAPDLAFSREGNPLDEILYLNPESRIAVYTYPVFQKLSRTSPPDQGAYPLLAYRHPDSGQVRFIALSPFFLSVLQQISLHTLPARKAIEKAAKEFAIPKAKALKAAEGFLLSLIKERAIYGFLQEYIL